jgi:type II secretory pathway component PulK
MTKTTVSADQRGLALVAVLWLVALLTVLATASVTISVGRARVVGGATKDEQARLVADAAIRLTLAELASPQSTRSASDATRDMDVFGQSVRVDVRFEDERLNVNTADRGELFRFFEREAPADALAIVARLEDWRDNDAQRLGAEWVEPRVSEPAYPQRHGPFESAQEVRQSLPRVDGDSRWIDAITVYTLSQQSTVSLTRQIAVGDIVRVQACAVSRECQSAVVRLTGNRRDPVQVLSWP